MDFRDIHPSSEHVLTELLRNLSFKLTQGADSIRYTHILASMSHRRRNNDYPCSVSFKGSPVHDMSPFSNASPPFLTVIFSDKGSGPGYLCEARNATSSHQSPGVSPLPSSARSVPGGRFTPHRDGSSQRNPCVLPLVEYPSLLPKFMVESQLRARNEGARVFRAARTNITPHRYG